MKSSETTLNPSNNNKQVNQQFNEMSSSNPNLVLQASMNVNTGQNNINKAKSSYFLDGRSSTPDGQNYLENNKLEKNKFNSVSMVMMGNN